MAAKTTKKRGGKISNKKIIAELANATGVAEADVAKVISELGLDNALKYAKPADNKVGAGLRLSILSGRFTVEV